MRLGSFFKQEGIGGKKEDRDIRFFLSPTLVREYLVRVILKGLPGPQALGILSPCLFLSPNRGVAGGVMQKVSKMLNAPLPHYGATLCRQLRRVKFTLLRFLFFFFYPNSSSTSLSLHWISPCYCRSMELGKLLQKGNRTKEKLYLILSRKERILSF